MTPRAYLTFTATFLSLTLPAAGQSVLHSFSGEASGDGLGIARSAGDLDGDGHHELILGAPLHDGGGSEAGQVRLVDGDTGATLFTWLGNGADDYLGRSVACAGDVDQDGVNDVILGAPGAPGSGHTGRIEVRSGATGALLLSAAGSEVDGAFGYAVAAAGDLNGDSVPDLYVAAPAEDHSGASDVGRVHVLSGSDGSSLGLLAGHAANDAFGKSLDGGWFASDGGTMDPPIGASVGGDGYVEVFDTTLASSFVVTGSGLGDALARIEDLDADGVADLIAGAWTQDRTYVLSGSDGSVVLDLLGTTGDAFGHAVSRAGDANGDGVPDLAVGRPLIDEVTVHSGVDGSVLRTESGQAGELYGWSLDHMGAAQVAIGSPLSGQQAGRVELRDVSRP